ncbi:MAG TPA: CTP synthase, partial [Bryobacteraceae bacterium]|nr:CTP synthase [Bryobacteraceae bacterium]
LFCDVDVENVITNCDVSSVYQLPLVFAEQGVDDRVLRLLRLDAGPRDLTAWAAMVDRLLHPKGEVSIGLVGKYTQYEDAYKSLKEALLHGGLAHNVKVAIHWIDSEQLLASGSIDSLARYDGILVPGGFGKRGIEGMIHAIRYARENKVPYFGICLGMQTMVIEYARNVCGLAGANSSEFDQTTPHRVIFKLRELKGVDELGGTMRLGAYPCKLVEGSFAHGAYGRDEISERHRHRYEFNRDYQERLTAAGLRIAGETPDGSYVEICELPDHPWGLGCQFHPEFKSKPLEPHPLFRAFIGAALEYHARRSGQKTTQLQPAAV